MSINKPLNILFLGHSLIEFFDWEGRFSGHNVVNLGVAGATVEGLLSRVDDITNKYTSADLVFVMTGANNIAMEDYEFFDPYRGIITRLKSAYPKARIYIHSVLPIIIEWIENRSIIEVNKTIRALAQETGVEFIDIHSHFVKDNSEPIMEYLLDDGVHLTDRGYEIWAGVLEEIIKN